MIEICKKQRHSKITSIVDNKTGEIISEKERNYSQPIHVKFKERHRFTKTYHIEMVEFEQKAYYKYFYCCICNLEMGTNRIVSHRNGFFEGISLETKGLAKICDVSEKTIKRFIDYCIDKKIIRRMDLDGKFFGYFVNPIYVFNGNSIYPILYIMFKEYGIDNYIDKRGIKLMDEYCKLFNTEDVIAHTFEKNTKKEFDR